MQTQADTVKDVFKYVELPAEGQSMAVLRGTSALPRGYRDVNGKGYVAWLGNQLFGFLGTLISEQTGRNYGISVLQENYDLVYSKTPEGKAFKQLNKEYWFHNAEVFRKTADGVIVFPRPKVVEKQGDLVYEGESKKIELKDNAVDTLTAAGLFKKGENKVWKGEIGFDDEGQSSVWSNWYRDEDCFYAGSHRPSYRSTIGGLAAFTLVEPSSERTIEQPEVKQVDAKYLADLERDAKKYRILQPLLRKITELQ